MATRRPWSTGCHSCRKMKVKCDEAKPACRRCTRADRTCPGYRQDSQMMFRSMNSWAAATQPPPPPVLVNHPSTDWHSFAISRFLHHFVVPSTSSSLGHLAYLPQLLRNPSQALHEAVLAAALGNFANVSGLRQLQVESQVHFGQALQCLRAALEKASTATAEETLAAVPVIQIYEAIAGITPRMPSQDPHEAGAARILRQRWDSQPNKQPRSNVEGLVQAKLGIHSLFSYGRGQTPSSDPAAAAAQPVSPRGFNPWGANKPPDSPHSFNPWGSKLWPWLLQVPVYCGKLRASAEQASNNSSSSLRHCFPPQQAARANFRNALGETWTFYSSEVMSRSSSTLSLRPDLLSAGGGIEPGRRILTATSWMLYWCSCVQLLQVLIESHALFLKLPLDEEDNNDHHHHHQNRNDNLLDSSSSSSSFSSSYSSSSSLISDISPKDLEHSLVEAVRNICAAGPFLLGDMYADSDEMGRRTLGAFLFLRGLKTALSVGTLPLDDRKVVLEYLGRIANQFGIKLGGRARDDWLGSHPVEADAFALVGG